MNNNVKSPVGKNHFPGSMCSVNAGVIFLQAVVFLFIMNVAVGCKNNNAAQSQAQQSTTDSLKSANDSLQSQNNAARVQLDNYLTKEEQLDSLIKQKDAEIAKLKTSKGYLERKNKKLASELKADKKLISSLRDELNDSSTAYESRLGLLQNDKNDLLRQKDELLAKYNHIIALGSVLHASGIRLTAIHLKHHGKTEKETSRARKADGLNVVFDIDENRIAQNGTKKLYLVIKDPSGNLLSNPSSGSGVTTASNGSPLNYSMLKEIPLITNQPVKDITVEWRQETDYERGTYTIGIYNDGYKIGGGQVELK